MGVILTRRGGRRLLAALGITALISVQPVAGGSASADHGITCWSDVSQHQYTGSNADDVIEGNDNPNVMAGKEGQDLISGAGQADKICGNAGPDPLQGVGGDDKIDGGDGSDWLLGYGGNDELRGDVGGDELWGGEDNDDMYGQNGNDIISEFAEQGANDYGNGGDDNDECSAEVETRISCVSI